MVLKRTRQRISSDDTSVRVCDKSDTFIIVNITVSSANLHFVPRSLCFFSLLATNITLAFFFMFYLMQNDSNESNI